MFGSEAEGRLFFFFLFNKQKKTLCQLNRILLANFTCHLIIPLLSRFTDYLYELKSFSVLKMMPQLVYPLPQIWKGP